MQPLAGLTLGSHSAAATSGSRRLPDHPRQTGWGSIPKQAGSEVASDWWTPGHMVGPNCKGSWESATGVSTSVEAQSERGMDFLNIRRVFGGAGRMTNVHM